MPTEKKKKWERQLKEETVPFGERWMDLETVTQSKSEKQVSCNISRLEPAYVILPTGKCSCGDKYRRLGFESRNCFPLTLDM